MGFKDKKNGKSGKSSDKKPSTWRKLGSVWENKGENGKFYSFTGDDYYGDLIFRDKESGVFYKVLGATLFDPKEGAPDNLIFNLSVDVSKTEGKYPNVEVMGDGENEDEESGSDD